MKTLWITETREVTCDMHYRFPTGEEHRQFSSSGIVPADWEWFCVDRWIKGGPWVYHPELRHLYRITCVAVPENYVLVDDPSFIVRPSVDIAIAPSVGRWHRCVE